MLKTFLLLTFFVLSFSQAHAKKVFCTKGDAQRAAARAKAHSSFDKNNHCATSCLLTLQCNRLSVLSLGLGKEVIDAFGSGNAEVADMRANQHGIQFASSGAAKNSSQCFKQCDLYY